MSVVSPDSASSGIVRTASLPPGYNIATAQLVLRYPQAELNALNNYETSGTIIFPNADLLIMSQVEMTGDCGDVFKKIFLVDLYETARAALKRLLAYTPQGFEQKIWYDAAQAWMEIWCRSTAIRGGTFRSSMAEWRLLRMQPTNTAPFPEKSDGQNLFRSISTLETLGFSTTTVRGTPWDFFGFTSDFNAPDGYENPNLAWPMAGPYEQYFGMPIWATIAFEKYRQLRGAADFAALFQYRGAPLIWNCGSQSPYSKNRGSLTGQRITPVDVGTLEELPRRGAEAPSNQRTMPTDLTNCMGSINSGPFIQALSELRRRVGLTTNLDSLARGADLADDKDWLWEQTGDYPVNVAVAVLDAPEKAFNTSNPIDIFFQALYSNPTNPLAGIATMLGGIYWQTGTAATGKMMCAGIRARMQEMADTEFMQLQATALTQYAAFLRLPENVAVAGASADQLAAAADAGAQSGVVMAAQITMGVGAAVALIPGVGTVIGGVIAGIGALIQVFSGLIHAQAWAPPPLWYRVLDHCNGNELRLTTIADITAYFQQIKFTAKSRAATISRVSNAFTDGLKGNGMSGQTKTWKLALWTLGGVSLVGLGAAIVRRRRERSA